MREDAETFWSALVIDHVLLGWVSKVQLRSMSRTAEAPSVLAKREKHMHGIMCSRKQDGLFYVPAPSRGQVTPFFSLGWFPLLWNSQGQRVLPKCCWRRQRGRLTNPPQIHTLPAQRGAHCPSDTLGIIWTRFLACLSKFGNHSIAPKFLCFSLSADDGDFIPENVKATEKELLTVFPDLEISQFLHTSTLLAVVWMFMPSPHSHVGILKPQGWC